MGDDFELLDGDRVVLRSMKKEPIFLAALRLATEMMHHGPGALFEPAATWGAEFDAANNALHAGESIDGARLLNPRFGRISASEWDQADC